MIGLFENAVAKGDNNINTKALVVFVKRYALLFPAMMGVKA
jgi:hypothetical protein